MKPGGVIQRVLTDPFKTEYLALDGAEQEWSELRRDAIFFESHAEADARAEVIRLSTGFHVYAAVATKLPPPVRELPPKKKVTRAERDREEMRQRDEAELEEAAAYG